MKRFIRLSLVAGGMALASSPIFAQTVPTFMSVTMTPTPPAATRPANQEPIAPGAAAQSSPTQPLPQGHPLSSGAEPIAPMPIEGTNPAATPIPEGCVSDGSFDADACAKADIWHVFPQDNAAGLRIYGWLDAGIIYNSTNPGSRFNGPYNALARSDEPMFNQAYLVIEKGLDQEGFSFGGRLDLLYGEDYLLWQAKGLERRDNGGNRWNDMYNGFAIPQAYAEFGNQDLSAKVGHFYSMVGYEGVDPNGNFFYSHSYSYQFAGPFTHTGALGTTKLDDHWQIQAGVITGWDDIYETENHASFLGGIKYAEKDKWWSSFAIVTGQEITNPSGTPGYGAGYSNRTRYSFLVDVNLDSRLEFVFHQWLGYQEGGYINGHDAWWYGVDQYMYYKLTDTIKIGARAEWFRDEEGTRVGLTYPDNPNIVPLPGNFFSLSLGVNWTPIPNLTVRPELRYDWFDGDTTRSPYDDGRRDQQFMLGLDAILRF